MVNVRVLYFSGCPNHKPAVDLVERVAAEAGVRVAVGEVEVRDQAEVESLRFVGSPTIQVNGTDVEPAARGRSDFHFGCRLYGPSGLPTPGLVRDALVEAAGGQGCCAPASDPPEEGRGRKSGGVIGTVGGAVFVAVLSSACCWLPAALVLLGFSAAGVSALGHAARPWLLGGSVLLLGLGFYLSYRRVPRCEPGECPPAEGRGRRRLQRVMLWVALAGAGTLAFLPEILGLRAADGPVELPAESPTVTLAIEGMDCEACAATLRQSLRQVAGVVDASVSYENGSAVIALDAASPPEASSLIRSVRDAGFEARPVE